MVRQEWGCCALWNASCCLGALTSLGTQESWDCWPSPRRAGCFTHCPDSAGPSGVATWAITLCSSMVIVDRGPRAASVFSCQTQKIQQTFLSKVRLAAWFCLSLSLSFSCPCSETPALHKSLMWDMLGSVIFVAYLGPDLLRYPSHLILTTVSCQPSSIFCFRLGALSDSYIFKSLNLCIIYNKNSWVGIVLLPFGVALIS